jgi:hypothetical protein
MWAILVGALLVLAGIAFIAVKEIRAGPLSKAKRPAGGIPPSLEPRSQGSILDPRRNWPGYILIVLGALLLFLGGPA